MRKYRGKHSGRTRGPYIREHYLRTFKSKTRTIKVSGMLHSYFCAKGYWVNGKAEIEMGPSPPDTGTMDMDTYHLAGATIVLTTIFAPDEPYVPRMNPHFKPLHLIDIKFVTNEGLDDILEKLSKELPIFRKFKKAKNFYDYA